MTFSLNLGIHICPHNSGEISTEKLASNRGESGPVGGSLPFALLSLAQEVGGHWRAYRSIECYSVFEKGPVFSFFLDMKVVILDAWFRVSSGPGE